MEYILTKRIPLRGGRGAKADSHRRRGHLWWPRFENHEDRPVPHRGGATTPMRRSRTEKCGSRCPAETTLDVIGGRWKVPVVWHLFRGTLRFSELRRALPDCTQKMLTQQLREL